MRLGEQSVRKVQRRLAGWQAGICIEGALGPGAFHPNPVQAVDEVLAALGELADHFLHAVLRTGQRLDGRPLRDGGRLRGALPHQRGHRADDLGRAGSITHPPSGHRIRLADRVDLDGPALHFLAERCRYHVGRIAVQEVLVGLVADQIDAPLDRQLGHGPHLVRVHDDPGRVIRAVQEDRACARGDVRLEVGPADPVIAA